MIPQLTRPAEGPDPLIGAFGACTERDDELLMDWITGVSQDAMPWLVLGWYLGRSGVASLSSQGTNPPSGKPL